MPAVLLVSALCLLRLLWRGDAPFLFDQAYLLRLALEANEKGQWAEHGLPNVRGFHYGPLSVWVYQVFLWIKHDVFVTQALTILLLGGLTAVALLAIARWCRYLRPEGAALAFLSPYLWFYGRDLWDNNWLIPITALIFASYLAFCASPRRLPFFLTGLTTVIGLLTHLMCLPLVGAIGLHFLVFQRKWARAHLGFIVGALTVALLPAIPYAIHVATHLQKAQPPLLRLQYSFFYSLSGPVLFTGLGFERFLGADWVSQVSPLLWGAIAVSALAFVFAAHGLYLSVRRLRHFRDGDTIRYDASFIAIVTLVSFTLLNLKMGLYDFPHYYHGVWIVFFYLVWLSVSYVKRIAPKILVGLYAAGLSITLAATIALPHRTGGNRERYYGATLDNLSTMAAQRATYDRAAKLTTETIFPLEPLELLTRFETWAPEAPKRNLKVRYSSPDVHDGRQVLDF